MKHQLAHFSNKIARKAQKAADGWSKEYWHDNPFGQTPRASKQQYLELWEEAKAQTYPEIDSYEKETGFAVDKDWMDTLALHTQIVVKDSKLCYQHGRVLYSALRDYLKTVSQAENINIVETGTARGFSSVIMAKALQDAKTPGKIITFDLLPHTRKMYWNCIDDHEGPKSRQELLKPWRDITNANIIFFESDSRIGLARAAFERTHFAFLDGAHTYDDVMFEFGKIEPTQEAGDMIVFDDYNPELFPGIVKAVDYGCQKWGYAQHVIQSRDNRAYVVAKKTG